jgi:hypothetical protein
MSSQLTKVLVPPAVALPPGAQWAAAAALWIAQLSSSHSAGGTQPVPKALS